MLSPASTSHQEVTRALFSWWDRDSILSPIALPIPPGGNPRGLKDVAFLGGRAKPQPISEREAGSERVHGWANGRDPGEGLALDSGDSPTKGEVVSSHLRHWFLMPNPLSITTRSQIEFTGLSSGKGQALLSLMSGWVENVGSTDPLIEFEVHSLAHSRGLLRLGISPINPPGKRVESCC